MAKTRQQKEAEVSELVQKLKRMKVAVFTTISGLSVKETNELRSLLRNSDTEYVVVKKTLLQRALQDASISGLDLGTITTSFALSFGYEDEITPAKLLAGFAKTHEGVRFLGGIFQRAFVPAGMMQKLAMLPSRAELQQQIVWTIAAPLHGYVRVLRSMLVKLVFALNALALKQREQALA